MATQTLEQLLTQARRRIEVTKEEINELVAVPRGPSPLRSIRPEGSLAAA